jgi:hypothetical protein
VIVLKKSTKLSQICSKVKISRTTHCPRSKAFAAIAVAEASSSFTISHCFICLLQKKKSMPPSLVLLLAAIAACINIVSAHVIIHGSSNVALKDDANPLIYRFVDSFPVEDHASSIPFNDWVSIYLSIISYRLSSSLMVAFPHVIGELGSDR